MVNVLEEFSLNDLLTQDVTQGHGALAKLLEHIVRFVCDLRIRHLTSCFVRLVLRIVRCTFRRQITSLIFCSRLLGAFNRERRCRLLWSCDSESVSNCTDYKLYTCYEKSMFMSEEEKCQNDMAGCAPVGTYTSSARGARWMRT